MCIIGIFENTEQNIYKMERVTWKLTLPYVKQIANGNLLYTQETQTGTLYPSRGVGWGGRWDRGSKGRRYMYTHGLFMLRFDRKQ